MNHRLVGVAGLWLLGSAVGCSSSSAGVEVDAGPGVDSASDANSGAEGDATSRGAGDDGSASIPDAQADRGSSPAEVDASAACASYCACMATNCLAEVFANGCLYECATQTTWDLECRAGMCALVPSEPANDHCTHAFGMNECLDK